jgi:hypothetical protein
MSGIATAIIGTAVIGGYVSYKSAKDARKAISKSGRESFDAAHEAAAESRELAQPFIDIGLGAGNQLQNMLANPNQGLEEINPVIDFLRKEGFEDIQESAAARGRLGAGGTLKDLTQFNSDLTSTVVPQLQNQRFNQLFNVLGLGANVSQGQGTQALNTAANQGNILQNMGQANANAAIQQGNAINNVLNTGAQAFGQFGSTPQSQQTANATQNFNFNTPGADAAANFDFSVPDDFAAPNYNALGGPT